MQMGRKIPPEKLYVQVTYSILIRKLWLIWLLRINCELYISKAEADSIDPDSVANIGRIFKKRGIRINLHAPLCDIVLEGGDKSLLCFRKSVDIARALSSSVMVVHAECEAKGNAAQDEWVAGTIGVWREIDKMAKEARVSVLIENHHELSARPITSLIEKVGSVNLAACFDIGHYHAFGVKDAASYLSDYRVETIREIHLSDNMKEGDSHLPLGKGSIDFASFFGAVDKLGIDAMYNIEAKDIRGIILGIGCLRGLGRL